VGTLTRGAADPGGGLAGVRLPSAPLFGREGLVDIVLSEALAPVLRDLASSGALLPDIRDEQWSGFDGQVTAMLYGPDDSGQGVFVMAGSRCRRESRRSRARSRKWAIEARWHADKSASWPECPEHPRSHPLAPVLCEDRPVWTCPRTGHLICGVGQLPSSAI